MTQTDDIWRDLSAMEPINPEQARAEQKRVLRLMEGTSPVLSFGGYSINEGQRDGQPRYFLATLCGAGVAELPRIQPRNKADAYLFSAAPTLATELAAAYGLIATLLERNAEREAALERVQVLMQDWESSAQSVRDHFASHIRVVGEGMEQQEIWDGLAEFWRGDYYNALAIVGQLRAALATAPAGGESK